MYARAPFRCQLICLASLWRCKLIDVSKFPSRYLLHILSNRHLLHHMVCGIEIAPSLFRHVQPFNIYILKSLYRVAVNAATAPRTFSYILTQTLPTGLWNVNIFLRMSTLFNPTPQYLATPSGRSSSLSMLRFHQLWHSLYSWLVSLTTAENLLPR